MNQPPNYPPDRDRENSRELNQRELNQRELNQNEQLRIQQAKEEARQLKQEEQRQKTIERRIFFARIVNSIYFLVGLLEVLLGIRFFLRVFGANPDNIFAQTIYTLSEPFVAPFSTLFISPAAKTEATIGTNIFDVNLLIAMIIYAILGALGVRITVYIQEQMGDPRL